MTAMSVSFVFALVPVAEGHDHLVHYSVAGCSNQMQVTLGDALVRVCALVQAPIGCCILLIVVPEMVLTLQIALVVLWSVIS